MAISVFKWCIFHLLFLICQYLPSFTRFTIAQSIVKPWYNLVQCSLRGNKCWVSQYGFHGNLSQLVQNYYCCVVTADSIASRPHYTLLIAVRKQRWNHFFAKKKIIEFCEAWWKHIYALFVINSSFANSQWITVYTQFSFCTSFVVSSVFIVVHE